MSKKETMIEFVEEMRPYQSLVFTKDQMKTRASPMSEALTEIQGIMNSETGKTPAFNLTQNELSIFRKILTRDLDSSKYEVVFNVANGGMGKVFCVYDKDIQRHTVLKTILPKYKDDLEIIKRFIFEARITGELEHPNIVPLHDFGFLPGHGIYFSMSYLHGESLLDIIDKLIAKDPDYCAKYDYLTLIRIFRKVCDAVAFAHSKDVIHRDIKPENIMVGQFGEVILMDWGLAKRFGESSKEKRYRHKKEEIADKFASPDSTQSGQIKGTPVYLSPEQSHGNPEEVDKLTDIFLLGATLYHIFTYAAPYAAENVKAAVKRAERADFKRPEKVTTGHENLSKELCSIINHAMAKEKEQRYRTVEELISTLDDLIDGKMQFSKREFKKGEFLIEEGQFGTECYIIQKGNVEVFKHVSDRRVFLGELKAGDIVGEMALITAEPRTATVVATQKTETVVLNKKIFTHNLNMLPPWMEKSITTLALRLSESNTKLTDTKIIDRNKQRDSANIFRL